jgi:hypothetical protein
MTPVSTTVVFLGAGASRASGGPTTDEILPKILASQKNGLLADFLREQFHVTEPTGQFPGLPLFMSLLDTALDRRQDFHTNWNAQRVAELRQAVEFGIFDVLEEGLQKAPTDDHFTMLTKVYPNEQPCVITTNYDLIADSAVMFLSDSRTPEGAVPDYRSGIATQFYGAVPERFGVVLKLHGSLNWLYCGNCQRLELGKSSSRFYLKILSRMFGPELRSSLMADGQPCSLTCPTKLRPLLVAPTHLKNYRNPHLARVWYEAERVLRGATRTIFIGYSLPEDDVEVVYLLKRGLAHLPPHQITVVDYAKDGDAASLTEHRVGRRYRTLFGDGIDWHCKGLNAWLGTF